MQPMISPMKNLLFFLLIGFSMQLFAQKETFDLATFSPPAGWQRETSKDVVSFVKINNTAKTWCRISIFTSVASTGDINQDFNRDWQDLIVKPNQVSQAPLLQPVKTFDGWKTLRGTSNYVFQGSKSVAILNTVSGYGQVVSMTALTNGANYLPTIDAFFASVSVQKPATATPQTKPTPPVNKPATQTPPPPPPVPQPATAKPISGFTFTTTTFDDGWNAIQTADFVHLEKSGTSINLHYGIALDDNTRNDVVNSMWNLLAAGHYQSAKFYNYNYSTLNFPYYYLEADVTEKGTNQKHFVAFLVLTQQGIASAMEVVSASKAAYTQVFPDLDKLAAMKGYNRFAVAKSDVVGNWESTSSAFVQYYNVYTGNSAGMNAASINDKFQFSANGNYTSEHKGASGVVGNQQFFQEKYLGSYAVDNWTMSTKDQNSKTSNYGVYFEAIKGGRILHLQNQQYSGMQYHLMKK